MTSKEIYETYKGCTVTDGYYTGEVIGYRNEQTILIGIKDHFNRQGWSTYDINIHDNGSTIPEFIPENKFNSYRYISKSRIKVIKFPSMTNNNLKNVNNAQLNVEKIANDWIKDLKGFNNIDEETANMLINAFIAGGETIKNYLIINK